LPGLIENVRALQVELVLFWKIQSGISRPPTTHGLPPERFMGLVPEGETIWKTLRTGKLPPPPAMITWGSCIGVLAACAQAQFATPIIASKNDQQDVISHLLANQLRRPIITLACAGKKYVAAVMTTMNS
jgi:hypothetical protein